jgi:hypothetical protein
MICVIIVLCKFNIICLQLSRGANKCEWHIMPSHNVYFQQVKLYESNLVFNSAAHGVWPKCVKGL